MKKGFTNFIFIYSFSFSQTFVFRVFINRTSSPIWPLKVEIFIYERLFPMENSMGLLRIHVIRGVNLAIRDVRSSDPYVIIRMGRQVIFLVLAFFVSRRSLVSLYVDLWWCVFSCLPLFFVDFCAVLGTIIWKSSSLIWKLSYVLYLLIIRCKTSIIMSRNHWCFPSAKWFIVSRAHFALNSISKPCWPKSFFPPKWRLSLEIYVF